MKQETNRGVIQVVVLGVVVFLVLGGALLFATHTPGNPPFSFTEQNADGEIKNENESDTSSSPAPEVEKTAKSATEKTTEIPSPQEKSKPAVYYSTQPQNAPQQSCTSNSNPQFTHTFTDLSKIDAINPIGGIGGGSPGRSYVGVKEGMEVPVYAPVSAILERIIYSDRGAGRGEYGVFLTPSCNIQVLFDHIDRLSDTIVKYAPSVPSSSTRTDGGTEPRIRVEAGELLGYTDGTERARTFDFLVQDLSRKNSFINPKRWEWEQALYGTCPYDYFTADLKAQYYAKLGKPSSTGFIKADTCGNPSHDIAGTASGGWFKGESTDKRGEYLAIARDYNDVQIAYRKDGMAFANMQDVQTGNPYFNMLIFSPPVYPSEITPGESVCYSTHSNWAFIKLATATELLFASGSGSCPSMFPESQADMWLR